ncbi:MAG: hypothetical protein KKA81_04655 [Bacteroidetes bacterium]|nr:hypothetical protein [Bacteroidota bacterium]
MRKIALTLVATLAVSYIFAQGIENWGFQDILGDYNYTEIDQYGWYNTSYQDVIGDYNDVMVFQYGPGYANFSDQDVYYGDFNYQLANQVGTINYARQEVMYGDGNVQYIYQWYFDNAANQHVWYGDNNYQEAMQFGESNTSYQRVWPGDYNDQYVYQSGYYNYAFQDIWGNSNLMMADQVGVSNSSYQTALFGSDFNIVNTDQFGLGNLNIQDVVGDFNFVNSYQDGEYNLNDQLVVGDGNYANTTQDYMMGQAFYNETYHRIYGDGNWVNTYQTGYNPPAYMQLSYVYVDGDYNWVNHYQQGAYNVAESYVFGDFNSAYIHQLGGKVGTPASENEALTWQVGVANSAQIYQGVWNFPLFPGCWTPTIAKPGYGNDAVIEQYGYANSATIMQADDFEGSWTWFNDAYILQVGDFNTASIYQNGDVNNFTTVQYGAYNDAISFGHGLENEVHIFQDGLANGAYVFIGLDNPFGNPSAYEYYSNYVEVNQYGTLNVANAFIVGDENTVLVDQYGYGNIAGQTHSALCPNDAWYEAGIRILGDYNYGDVFQYGTMNLADMQIIGNFNTAYITQY